MEAGSDLVLETVDLIVADKVKTQVQPKTETFKKAPKLRPENTRIDWGQPAEKIYNFIRGLAMYPGAWTEIKIKDNEPVKKLIIYKSRFIHQKHKETVGQVTAEKKLIKIAVPDGFVYPEILKLQGKKQMDIVSFLNGIKNKDAIEIIV
jgi:methionyl-tRNA formyltransferase